MVEPQPVKTDFVFLSTPELVDAYWSRIEPHLRRYVDEATHGELTVEDLYVRAVGCANTNTFTFIVKTDQDDVELAIVAEAVQYPRLSVLNIVAIGGRNLKEFHEKYWNILAGWAHLIGFRGIEGMVSEVMARALAPIGFKKLSVVIRAPTVGE